MAEVLKEWDFSRSRERGSKYPWDEWTNGDIIKVKQGVDFQSKPSSFRSALQSQATKLSEGSDKLFKVKASVDEKNGIVVFQFYTAEKPAAKTTKTAAKK